MKWSAIVLIFATVACGPGTRQGANGDDDDGTDAGGSNIGSGSGSDGCSDDAKLIYVVDETNKLARFDPTAKTFTTLGTLNCPAGVDSNGDPAAPFSMAVDRTAQAYVLYNDDKIYKVDTTMASLPCAATGWHSSTNPVLQEFGMGYSTDTMGGSTDTLFIAGGADLQEGDGPATSTLATLDTSQFAAAKVGTVTGWPELTGNSNAELWGFFPDVNNDGTTPTVVQINKASGAAMTTFMEPSLDGEPAAWAFGFYGGDYWVFLSLEDDSDPLNPTAEPTKVYQVAGPSSASGSPGSVVSTTSAGGLIIVGAGVSTCAPIVIQ